MPKSDTLACAGRRFAYLLVVLMYGLARSCKSLNIQVIGVLFMNQTKLSYCISLSHQSLVGELVRPFIIKTGNQIFCCQVTRQSSGSKVQVTRQSFASKVQVTRQSSGNKIQVTRQSSGNKVQVIRQSSWNKVQVTRQSAGNKFKVTRQSYEKKKFR